MKKMKWTDQTSADKSLRRGQEEEVLVVRDGHPVALIVPFDDDDLEWYVREHDPKFLKSIARAKEDIAAGRGISHDEVKKRFRVK